MNPSSPLHTDSRIYVAGHRGMVGSAIVRALKAQGYRNIITRTHNEMDLTCQGEVRHFFQAHEIDYVVLAAAKVGGIHANNVYPADFIYENLMIEANIIHQAFKAGVTRLLFLGSSCIYPKLAGQPMQESALLTGTLEPTNEPYAIAKIAGIKLCESYNRQHGTHYRSVMPTNLYGPGDNYHPENSHVIPGLIRRIHEAKETGAESVTVWGTGKARREFLYVDDLARACVFVMGVADEDVARITEPMCSHLNVGTGTDVTIKELAELISQTVGFEGKLDWDTSKPDGTPRKLMDTSLLNRLGWQPNHALREGLAMAYEAFCNSEMS